MPEILERLGRVVGHGLDARVGRARERRPFEVKDAQATGVGADLLDERARGRRCGKGVAGSAAGDHVEQEQRCRARCESARGSC